MLCSKNLSCLTSLRIQLQTHTVIRSETYITIKVQLNFKFNARLSVIQVPGCLACHSSINPIH